MCVCPKVCLGKNRNMFCRNGTGDNHDIMKSVGADLCEALVAYEDGDFSKVVDLIYPKRYDIIRIGGSNAQVCLNTFSNIHETVSRNDQ